MSTLKCKIINKVLLIVKINNMCYSVFMADINNKAVFIRARSDEHKEERMTQIKEATAELFVNEKKTGETKIEKFHYTTGAGAPTSLKINKHTSVYDVDYTSPFEYNGIIEKVVIDVADSSVDVKEELEKALHVD